MLVARAGWSLESGAGPRTCLVDLQGVIVDRDDAADTERGGDEPKSEDDVQLDLRLELYAQPPHQQRRDAGGHDVDDTCEGFFELW